MTKIIPALALTLAVTLAWGGAAFADPYTLTTCPVSGEKLGQMGDAVVKDYDGQEVRFCCESCVAKFEKDKKTYLEKIDKEIIAKQEALYPIDTCIVAKGSLTAKGEPVKKVYQNRLVEFCCSGCEKKFDADPAKFISELNAAVVEKQKPTYPLTTCVVKGGALGDKPVNVVVGGRLVEVCCAGCEKKVKAEPAKYLAMVDEAAQAKKDGK